jgi:ribonuclease BN (tRNA processing enzyme)
MKLTILGSGTMMPTATRKPSAYLVESGDTRLLLDCGHTTVATLVNAGIDLHSITAIAVTHFHTDHFADVLPFTHARFVDDLMAKATHTPLQLIGPRTLEERFKKAREISWPEPAEGYPLSILELEGTSEAAMVGSLELVPFTVNHVPWFPSIGYKISEGPVALVYPGDLGKDQEDAFYAQLEGLDTLLIEAASLVPKPNHFSPQQALELKEKYGIKRVIITHIPRQRLEAVRTFVSEHPGLILAEDGMAVEIG